MIGTTPPILGKGELLNGPVKDRIRPNPLAFRGKKLARIVRVVNGVG